MKTLQEYMNMYHEETKAATPGDYVALPEVWIAAKWTVDENVEPWEVERFETALKKLEAEQPDLADCIYKGLDIMFETMKKMESMK